MKRRQFISRSLAGSALASLGGLSLTGCSVKNERHLTVLHTNDVHSHIDPFPANHRDFPNLGGVARRASLIHKIRKEKSQHPLVRCR